MKQRMFIPAERLPPGFVERMASAEADPVRPRPAATVALLRDTTGGPQVLLLRRNRSAGFVPGAYVFPGGRVDEADADAGVWRPGPPPDHPPAAYWAAALRELFEETGILLARDSSGAWAADSSDPHIEVAREALLADRESLRRVLERPGLRAAIDRVVYIAHWITPVAEPRRYDTRFFLAALPEGRTAREDAREMSDAVWLTPQDALSQFAEGRLPMVFPTVRTLESLLGFETVEATLEWFRGRPVDPVLPRLVRTDRGVALVVDGGTQNDG